MDTCASSMFSGWEWLIAGAVTLVIILWGPTKIPQLAKALSRARSERAKALNTDLAGFKPPTNMGAKAQTSKSRDEFLVETAQKLGISTAGKNREELTREITMKIDLLVAD